MSFHYGLTYESSILQLTYESSILQYIDSINEKSFFHADFCFNHLFYFWASPVLNQEIPYKMLIQRMSNFFRNHSDELDKTLIETVLRILFLNFFLEFWFCF